MQQMLPFLWVFLGGGAGSACRYGIGLAVQPLAARYPLATLAANAAACLVLGFLTGLQLRNGLAPQHRLLLATGFCGGLSTFSTFTGETWALFQNGDTLAAFGNVAGSLGLCFACLFLGMRLGGQ